MGNREIERKFLIHRSQWTPTAPPQKLQQGYLSSSPECTVRVRIADSDATLTIKGRTVGHTRTEYEYPIPLADALELLPLCQHAVVEKRRHKMPHEGFVWEVDVFEGANAGLIVAEIEADSDEELARAVAAKPHWVGDDVTENEKLYNALLARHPFSSWSEADRAALQGG